MQQKNNSSLVSVIISTYNSSPFIIETLNSVSDQTWQDVELIITDDSSTDNTVELCREWLNKNKRKFINAIILTSHVNSGISANANRGLQSASGNWIKFLGADDTLTRDCLKDNMEWILSHPQTKVLFSRVNFFKDVFHPETYMYTSEDDSADPWSIMYPLRNAASQYRMLLVSDRLHYTPSVFICRETIIEAGGFDERFQLLEDYPLWLNLTRKGTRLYFMNKITVNYRIHSRAINNTGRSCLVNPNYFRSEAFRKIYTYPFLPKIVMLEQKFSWYASQIFRYNRFNRATKTNRLIYNVLTIYINPFRYLIWLKRKLCNNLIYDEFYR